MARASRTPVTAAVRALRAAGIEYTEHLYSYDDHRGAQGGAGALSLPAEAVIKTLVMETETGAPLLILMHGDRTVSTKGLARLIGARTVSPCAPKTARQHTGYVVGGTSPIGTRAALPVYAERTITELDRIYVNGGKRGFLVGLSTGDLIAALSPVLVDVAI